MGEETLPISYQKGGYIDLELRVTPIKYIDNHHTAGYEKNTQAVRVEHVHRGWGDIGYNSVIEKDGTIGIGRSTLYSGAHDPGVVSGERYSMNQMSYAISSIGYFHPPYNDVMSDVQFEALVKENLRIMRLYNIPLSNVRCHRMQYATACPGNSFPWSRLLQELANQLQGGTDVLKLAILLNSEQDFFSGIDLERRGGGTALFIRNSDKSIPKDAFSATQLIVVGGASTGHPNEVLLSGLTKYDTAESVGRYLK